MAGYFSNLSSTSTQSRFLSNKEKDPSAQSTGSHPPSRIPSKHFSTTLSDEQKAASLNEKSPTITSAGLPAASIHPLRSTYVRPTTDLASDLVMTTSPLAQMGLLVPPAARARQQNHQLRGWHQEDLRICFRRVLLVPLDASAPTFGPPAHD
jgi:hypothetical protein